MANKPEEEIKEGRTGDTDDPKRLLKDPRTGGDVLDDIARKHKSDLSLMELVASHPNVKGQTLFFLFNNTGEDFKSRLQEIKTKKVPLQSETGEPGSAGKELTAKTSGLREKKKERTGSGSDHSGRGAIDVEKLSLYGRIQTMSVAEKVQFALKSGKDARSILIKDSNRQVSMAVLSSPKITEDEVLVIAQSRNVSDELLRGVAKNKEWMKNYSILLSLVNNPKTPLPISMPLLPSLKKKDLGMLGKSKNVPEGIRSGAARLYAAKSRKE